MTDVDKSQSDGADEVIGDNWPTDSADDAAAAADEQRRIAAQMDEAGRAAAQGKAYASQEMEGAAAEALAAKYGIHMGQFADRLQAHLYTAGWLSMLAMAITSTKQAMNAAVDGHLPVHMAPKADFFDAFNSHTSAKTQAQKDANLKTAREAVQAAKQNLEHVKTQVALGISSGMKPPLVPSLPKNGQQPPTTKNTTRDETAGLPGDAPPAAAPAPGASAPGGPSTGTPGPGGIGAPSAPAPVSPLGGSAGRAPAATLPPPTLNDLPAGGSSGLGGSPMGSGSPFGGSPMGGMPMGGMPGGMPQIPQMQPPQMPQLPTQTPGNDIAKTVGDTVGKLAGAHNGQPISSDTLGKLLDAQRGDGAGPGGAGGLGDDKGTVVKNDDGTLVDDGKNGHGLKPHTPGPGLGGPAGGPTDPYSAENRNPSLNNPAGPQVTGPPSPAAPTVTPQPPVVSAPITQLSADDATPPPAAAHTTAAAGGDPTQAATHTAANGNGSVTAPPPGGANGAQPAAAQNQQQPSSSGVGGALGAYPGGAGFAPLPPAPPMSPAMMGGGAAMPAALGAAAVGGAAATPVIMPAKTATTSTSSNTGRALAADPAAAASVERITVLPPEHAVAHEHLAGVVKALRDRPGIAWTSARAAIGVFLFEEPGLPSRRVRYILATTDGLSVIPMDVKLPAGLELLSAVVDPSGSFAADWGGHERPALKLAAAADAYANVLGQLDYLVSNDTADGSLAPAKTSGVTEVVQTMTQTDALIATRKASPATMPRVNAAAPHIPPGRAADALDAFGRAWRFDDGTPNDLKEATTRLWAARWGVGKRRLERPADYAAILATYWYVEGQHAVANNRLDEAAYAAYQLAMINP